MVKRIFAVFLAVSVLAFVLALPAVASPPEAGPVLAVASLELGNAFDIYIQEPAVAVAPASNLPEPVTAYYDGFAAIGLTLVLIAIATAATLAYFMRGNESKVMRERNGRGFAKGFDGGRRWV